MDHSEWMAVLRESILRWTRTAAAAERFFEGGGAISLDEIKNLVDAERAAADEHWKVIQGDAETCDRIEGALKKAER